MYIVPDHVFEARFWERTDRVSLPGCWLWTGPTINTGYGQVTRHRRHYLAHRYAYTLAVGPVPDGHVIRHTCDQPLCINPAHLSSGTQADNLIDMVSRGRTPQADTKARGSRHGRAKLREDAVREIRASAASGTSRLGLAHRYHVSLATIDQIINRRIWKHVD